MKFGFVIDNRKCIGCHACTVACKSEHDVPVGVNRTWVRQAEKGTFPNTRRVFSVSRCNHCSDAPCVSICPTEALYTRDDGIVDFNNDRCIGCKSCMQACPYDALYIDPETHTAAKCNYCSHRTDIGLEPACVNVCPEHAIISGDMEDPNTEISQLLAREPVTVRKPEKGTSPNVFYIEGDDASLNPAETERSDQYIWNSQSAGVGHYARYAASRENNIDVVKMAADNNVRKLSDTELTYGGERPATQVEELMARSGAKRVYDTPDKGILWGWEVAAYLLTKGVAAGVILVLFSGMIWGITVTDQLVVGVGGISLFFLALTGGLLVKDLDRPDRFLYVLLRPQWGSWLVRGGYAITLFGGLVVLWLAGNYTGSKGLAMIGLWASAFMAVIVAVYTAFLFAQAKGRDFWQSPSMVFHMFVHSLMGGSAALLILTLIMGGPNEWIDVARFILIVSTVINVLIMMIEVTITHPTQDAKLVVRMIVKGRYANMFWMLVILFGNILPVVLLGIGAIWMITLASLLILMGIYFTEKIWVEAPQRISLT